ncbi:hypothetical protein GCM10010278_81350 [Streptomyces melanogenes]|nr:hypothetical protein GCM10010278_81350 [Streptomyces melanogenes]
MAAAGDRPVFRQAVTAALHALTQNSDRVLLGRVPDAPPTPPDRRLTVIRTYLEHALPDAEISLVLADTLEALPERVAQHVNATGSDLIAPEAPHVLIVTDHPDPVPEPCPDLQYALRTAVARMPTQARAEVSVYGTVAYVPRSATRVRYGNAFARREPPAEPGDFTCDIAAALADYVQARLAGAPMGQEGPDTSRPALAIALQGFLASRAGSRWGLHSYTGSVVSALISSMEELARQSGNPVLRAPSEHGLACGALARWQLDGAPFLIIVTSGMIDEFKGTLANLQQARAQGFILCADASGSRWFPFQGTVHAGEDSRAVVHARRLPVIHLERPEHLAEGLARAYAAYEAGRGPVVIIASPSVLESTRAPLPAPLSTLPGPRRAEVREDETAPVLRILSTERTRLLWQPGVLTASESELLHQLAARCGAALCDSLGHPGAVTRHRAGQRVPEYLGTLALYGTSAPVHRYLHQDGRLRDREEQALFFFKTRIPELATPFTEHTLARRLRIIQVNHEAEHRAPFVDHPVRADLTGLLRHLAAHADVPHELLTWRRQEIERARQTVSAPERVPQLLHLADFYGRLGSLLEQLITGRGYRYTGVFDVGRAGFSAVRNLPRTGPGFSGWYGRALMGDALMAVPALALTRPGHLLGFIGDGAAALVPDIVPVLIQQVWAEGCPLRGNISLFFFHNGGHSIIRTYREVRRRAGADAQSAILSLLPQDSEDRYGPLTVRRRTLHSPPTDLADQLQQPSVLNLYSVVVAHDNTGDGLNPSATPDWRNSRPGED